jgi:hypothetical protein
VIAIVSVETVLLVVLVVLVAGLLRSHAEILRRLEEGAAAPGPATGPVPSPAPGPVLESAAPARVAGAPAATISGPTPDGDALAIDFGGHPGMPTLLAFLTSGCTTCAGFWETLGEPRLAGVQTVIVAHGEQRERPAKLRRLAPAGVPVVMSSQAWRDYGVPASPYFVLVDGSVRGEGAATSWTALSSLVSDAIEDQREARNGTARADTVDRTLAGAGIGPGHPSLYPGRAGPQP